MLVRSILKMDSLSYLSNDLYTVFGSTLRGDSTKAPTTLAIDEV